MEKTTSRQTIKLLLCLLGVVLFVVSYFSIRPRIVDKSEKLASESVKLATQLTQLTDLETNEAIYAKRAKEYEQGINKILDKYPANVLAEDVVLYATELIGRKENMQVSVIGITDAVRIAGMNDQAESTDSEEGTEAVAGGDLGILDYNSAPCPNYEFFGVGGNYDFVAGYEDVKSILAQILADPDKRNVPMMSLTYEEETGLLVGNIGVVMYYITGTDKLYQEPNAGDIPKGNPNIFGTIETTESVDTVDTADPADIGETKEKKK